MDAYPLLAVSGLEKTNDAFRRALVRGSLARGYDPSFIAAVISNESGFDPNVQNRLGAPALGLLQFWRDYFPAIARRAGMRVTWEDLRHLSAIEQLPLVFAYFDGTRLSSLGAAATPTDYYMATFLPALVGAPRDRVLGERDAAGPLPGTGLSLDKLYRQNPGFDHDGDGRFTVADVGRKVELALSRARGREPYLVPLAEIPLAEVPLAAVEGEEPSDGSPSASPPTASSPTPEPERARGEPSADPSAVSSPPDSSDDDLATLPPDYRLVTLPTLSRQDAGLAVYVLQTLLGYLKRDSLFGPLTEKRLKTFQEVAGLRKPDSSEPVATCDGTWALLAKHAGGKR